ncbi:NUDIX hydrolase domain-like protein [Xylariomycetidae sp. FL2044]|nr:NUDIX hydrolase domain-like protein [Xylariomycetidae sp. FL2044]
MAVPSTEPALGGLLKADDNTSLPGTEQTQATPTPTYTFTISPDALLDPFQVTEETYLSTYPTDKPFNGVATGSFVFRPSLPNPSSSSLPSTASTTTTADLKLLIVQRAEKDSMPLRWEVPGGAYEKENDATVLHAAARELLEESGLAARRILGLVRHDVIDTPRSKKHILKISFLVEVDDDAEVRLNPNEHEAFLWVGLDEVKARRCGDVKLEWTHKEQEEAIKEAFKVE